MSTHPKHLPLTVEQWQDNATPRTELLHGFEYDLRAQATTARHAQLCSRIATMLSTQLSHHNSDCVVYNEGPLVRIDDNLAHLPDVSVECIRHAATDDMHITPSLVVEVLSPTTRLYDLRIKRENYKTANFIEYIVFVDESDQSILVLIISVRMMGFGVTLTTHKSMLIICTT